MNLLGHRDVVKDKHSGIIVIEVPILGANRVKHGIRPFDVTIDVAGNFTGFEFMMPCCLSYSPISIV